MKVLLAVYDYLRKLHLSLLQLLTPPLASEIHRGKQIRFGTLDLSTVQKVEHARSSDEERAKTPMLKQHLLLAGLSQGRNLLFQKAVTAAVPSVNIRRKMSDEISSSSSDGAI